MKHHFFLYGLLSLTIISHKTNGMNNIPQTNPEEEYCSECPLSDEFGDTTPYQPHVKMCTSLYTKEITLSLFQALSAQANNSITHD